MKKLAGLLILVLIMVSATYSPYSKQQETSILEGNWELVSFYSYDGINITDTIPIIEGYRQVKMYSHGRVMWTRHIPNDSVEWFGYGSFKTTDESLTETLEFGSARMTEIMKNSSKTFTFELDHSEDTYSQITIDEEGNRTTSENYTRIK